jgi:hypothetical protein
MNTIFFFRQKTVQGPESFMQDCRPIVLRYWSEHWLAPVDHKLIMRVPLAHRDKQFLFNRQDVSTFQVDPCAVSQ